MAKKVYFNENDQPMTRAELSTYEYLQREGKVQTISDLKMGKLRIAPFASALRFVVPNGTGRMALLTPSSVAVKGAIPEEFNRSQLPDGTVIAIEKILIGFVAHETGGKKAQELVTYGNNPNSWPAALRNGEMIWSQNNDVKLSICLAACGAKVSYGNVEEDSFELQSPLVIGEGKQTKIELETADGQSFTGEGTNALEIQLFGSILKQRF